MNDVRLVSPEWGEQRRILGGACASVRSSPSSVGAHSSRGVGWRSRSTSGCPSGRRASSTRLNGLPGGIWPVVWLPMQTGSLIGSLVVVGATASREPRHQAHPCRTGRESGRVLERQGRKGGRVTRTAERVSADVHVREKSAGLDTPRGTPRSRSRWRPCSRRRCRHAGDRWRLRLPPSLPSLASTGAPTFHSTSSAAPESGCSAASRADGRSASVAKGCLRG